MTNAQLYLIIGVPLLANALIVLMLSQLRSDVNRQFDSVNRRFDDMRDLWKSELLRVEGVLDARLRHLEETRR